jgi:hypothetical protein
MDLKTRGEIMPLIKVSRATYGDEEILYVNPDHIKLLKPLESHGKYYTEILFIDDSVIVVNESPMDLLNYP